MAISLECRYPVEINLKDGTRPPRNTFEYVRRMTCLVDVHKVCLYPAGMCIVHDAVNARPVCRVVPDVYTALSFNLEVWSSSEHSKRGPTPARGPHHKAAIPDGDFERHVSFHMYDSMSFCCDVFSSFWVVLPIVDAGDGMQTTMMPSANPTHVIDISAA